MSEPAQRSHGSITALRQDPTKRVTTKGACSSEPPRWYLLSGVLLQRGRRAALARRGRRRRRGHGATDDNDRAWKEEEEEEEEEPSPPRSAAKRAANHQDALRARESGGRVDGGMLIGETPRRSGSGRAGFLFFFVFSCGGWEMKERKKRKRGGGVSTGKPASCPPRSGRRCRSNGIAGYRRITARHYTMNAPCPSGTPAS